MNKKLLIKALKNLKVQTGSLVCLGCGHEHSCTTKGCAIIRSALEELEKMPPFEIGQPVYEIIDDGVLPPYINTYTVEDVSYKGIWYAGEFASNKDLGKVFFASLKAAQTALQILSMKEGK